MKGWFGLVWVRHLLFWLLVFACYCVSNWDDFSEPSGVLSTYGLRVSLQVITAYVCLLRLLPSYLRTRRLLPAVLGLAAVVFISHTVFTTAKYLYLEPTYPEAFRYCTEKFAGWSLFERVFHFKYAFLFTPVDLFPPTLVLVAIEYYRKQQQLSELSERQRGVELTVLKNQLNPHFLFNTLNNLYTLALKKSDHTATAIAELSDILDHILYRCNERFVALDREVELLESYVALEKLRYGTRVEVRLEKQLLHELKIAPLLLLTFLENAFKHGVSQEIDRATIEVCLRTGEREIDFSVRNSIPTSGTPPPHPDRDAIGLTNIRQQLALLYPGRHRLTIARTRSVYSLNLRIRTT